MSREQLVYYGVGMEIALLLVAGVISWIWPIPFETDPLRVTTFLTNVGAILIGFSSAVGMFAVGFSLWLSPLPVFRRMRQFLMEQLAPAMSQCQAWELIVIAISAGVGEEVLFRGVLQPRIGWIASAVLFGLLHSVSPTYIIVTLIMGAALAWIQILGGNLWAPIIAHSVYDYWMFLVLIRAHRKELQQSIAIPGVPTD